MGGMEYDITAMIGKTAAYFEADIEVDDVHDIDSNKAFMEDNINQNRPVLSLLSRKSLSYMDETLRDDVTHAVNVIGYHWDKKKLCIADPYIPTIPVSTYIGELSLNDYYDGIKDARDIFNRNYRYNCISFIPSAKKQERTYDREKLIRPLKNMAERFFNEESQSDGIFQGRLAYQQFYDDYKQWISCLNQEALFKIFRLVHHKLTNYGGVVVANGFMTEYLEYVIQKDASPKFVQIREMYEEISKRWLLIANLFGKYSFRVTANDTKNLSQRLEEVMVLEEKVYQQLI